MDIKEKLAKYNISPNKALGQNFLADENAVAKIIAAADIKGKCVLEIGPGLGALTHELNALSDKLLAVEIDQAMVDALCSQDWERSDSIRILHSDFLKLDDADIVNYLGECFSVVANLPYYITTPICMKLLQSGLHIETATLMMQKEAALRFTAPVGSKLYGPLTILSDYLFNISEALELSPASYYPQPDVHSIVLKLTYNGADMSLVKPLSRILKTAFSMRRKTIQNNLTGLGISKTQAADMLAAANISCSKRAEQLSTEDYLRLI